MFDFGVWGELAKLGIGTLMSLGMIFVVYYLLKYTLPEYRKSHIDDVKMIHEQHQATLKIVIDEGVRANTAICLRLEKTEKNQDRHAEALSRQGEAIASILSLLQAK